MMTRTRRHLWSRADRRPKTVQLLERRGQVCDAGCYAESRRDRELLRARSAGALW